MSKLSLILFSDYYDNAYYPQYECNVPLLDQAVISATTSLRERGPENARLNGKRKKQFITEIERTENHG